MDFGGGKYQVRVDDVGEEKRKRENKQVREKGNRSRGTR